MRGRERTDVQPGEVLSHPALALLEVSGRGFLCNARDGEADRDRDREEAREPVEPHLRRQAHRD